MKRVYEGILQTGVANGVFTQTEIEDWWKAFDEDGRAGNLYASANINKYLFYIYAVIDCLLFYILSPMDEIIYINLIKFNKVAKR